MVVVKGGTSTEQCVPMVLEAGGDTQCDFRIEKPTTDKKIKKRSKKEIRRCTLTLQTCQWKEIDYIQNAIE